MSKLEQELHILEEIERNPDVTQADLAARLGVAVGSVNWYIKRLVNKGYVKVTRLQRRKLHYFLTPSGLALKVKLTRGYMEASLRVYRELRQAAQDTLSQVHQAGYTAIHIKGNDEAAEILRLTCLEQNFQVISKPGSVPSLQTDGVGFVVQWPDANTSKMKTQSGKSL